MIIAVDFDGTVVTHEYPDIGAHIPGAFETLRELTALGHKILLWTMRSGKELDDARKLFAQQGVDLWGANSNPEQHSWTSSPKQYAHIYIDDAALGCPLMRGQHLRPMVDWVKVRILLREKGINLRSYDTLPQRVK